MRVERAERDRGRDRGGDAGEGEFGDEGKAARESDDVGRRARGGDADETDDRVEGSRGGVR